MRGAHLSQRHRGGRSARSSRQEDAVENPKQLVERLVESVRRVRSKAIAGYSSCGVAIGRLIRPTAGVTLPPLRHVTRLENQLIDHGAMSGVLHQASAAGPKVASFAIVTDSVAQLSFYRYSCAEMDVESLFSVSETAEQLGLDRSRVRALIAAGRLPARRVGRDWFVGIGDVTRFQEAHRRPGRPLSPTRAWAVLEAAERSGRVDVPRSTAAHDPFWLVNLVRQRASVRRLHALERLVPDIANNLVAGGEPAARQHGIALRDSRPTCDGYIQASEAGRIIDRFALVDASGADINVLLRVIDDSMWPFAPGANMVGPLIAAVDMLSDPIDDRSIDSALPIVERYL
jgi:excisionase family DNA binding protein